MGAMNKATRPPTDAIATKAAWATCRACRAAWSRSICRCGLRHRAAVPVLLDGDHRGEAERADDRLQEFQPVLGGRPTLEHFRYLLFETSYPGWLWNTILISTASTFLSLFASVFAAYAIERLRFSGSRRSALRMFLAYLVPPSILFIPLWVWSSTSGSTTRRLR